MTDTVPPTTKTTSRTTSKRAAKAHKSAPDGAVPNGDQQDLVSGLLNDMNLLMAADALMVDAPRHYLNPELSREEQRVLLSLLERDDVTSMSNGRHHYADETYSALTDLVTRGYVTAGVAPGLGACKATFVLTREGRSRAEHLRKAS